MAAQRLFFDSYSRQKRGPPTPVASSPQEGATDREEGAPRAGKHVRVPPCAPQWQRKLEAPLRVVIAVINGHEDFRGQRLIIVWKSLTVMAPTDSQDFNPDHTAFARLFYGEQGGGF